MPRLGQRLSNVRTYSFSRWLGRAADRTALLPSCPDRRTASSFSGTNFQSVQTGTTVGGSTTIYNVGSILGMAVGNPISGTGIPANSTIASFTTSTAPFSGATWSTSSNQINFTPTNVYVGMEISDVPNSCIPSGDTVTGVYSSYVTIGPNNTTCASSGSNIAVSGGNEIIFSNPTGTGASSSGQVSFTAYTGLYRLLGAVYSTAGTNPILIPFSQDNDTFYLKSSVVDIDTISNKCPITQTFTFCTLSVPLGVKVEAFGRMVAGNNPVLISSPDQAAHSATTFPGPPGFSTSSIAANTSFPFRSYTNTAGQILVQPTISGPSPTVLEDTDGWVFKRSQ